MRRRVSTAESFGESSGASEKTESDSGFHWAMRRDLAATKDVQEAFFPPESLSIPCWRARRSTSRFMRLAVTITIFSLCRANDGGSQLGMYPGKELVQP